MYYSLFKCNEIEEDGIKYFSKNLCYLSNLNSLLLRCIYFIILR